MTARGSFRKVRVGGSARLCCSTRLIIGVHIDADNGAGCVCDSLWGLRRDCQTHDHANMEHSNGGHSAGGVHVWNSSDMLHDVGVGDSRIGGLI